MGNEMRLRNFRNVFDQSIVLIQFSFDSFFSIKIIALVTFQSKSNLKKSNLLKTYSNPTQQSIKCIICYYMYHLLLGLESKWKFKR